MGTTVYKTWTKEVEKPLVHKPTKITISPEKAENPVGTTHTVTVFVYDTVGRPMAGIPVILYRTGAHTETTFPILTDAAGKVSFTYSSWATGLDTITAEEQVTRLKATATKSWVKK